MAGYSHRIVVVSTTNNIKIAPIGQLKWSDGKNESIQIQF